MKISELIREHAARPLRRNSLNEHITGDGAIMFEYACKLALEGSKRRDSRYISGRSLHWIKSKNPNAPAVIREAEEYWGKWPRRERRSSQSLGHIRSHGCRDLLIYCEAIDCNHASIMNADHLPDDLPIRSLGLRMVCARCGHRGADVRPDWRPMTNKRHI